MEAFKVGDIIVAKTGNNEYTVVEVTDNLIAVLPRSSGMKVEWWEKSKVKGQIMAGVWEMKK